MDFSSPVHCNHPDHTDDSPCWDRAVGCHPLCRCCVDRGVKISGQVLWELRQIVSSGSEEMAIIDEAFKDAGFEPWKWKL